MDKETFMTVWRNPQSKYNAKYKKFEAFSRGGESLGLYDTSEEARAAAWRNNQKKPRFY